MPKEKPFKVNIAKKYRYDTIDNWIFGYVMGAQDMIKTITIKRAIELAYNRFGLTEDDYPLESALQVYYKAIRDFDHRN